jgi:sugar lactone lactonase YvrE
VEIYRVGDFTLGWGESLVWDERRRRLYFVDCAARTLHWLDDGDGRLQTFRPPSLPTGIVPTDDGQLVAVLDDGLYVIDPDGATADMLARYPDAIDGRCNDACADLAGNLITGKLNLGPAEGSAWQYSRAGGWRLLDDDISNTNGPAVAVLGGVMTLVIGDTEADYFSYVYDAENGSVGPRSVFGDTSTLDGSPDGSTFDAGGGLWCALVGGGQLARFTSEGLDRTIAVPVQNPTDVTFGGVNLDRLFVVSIAAAPGSGASGLDGALLAIDGLDVGGRPEPRFSDR